MYFWKITEVSSRGALLMGVEKISEQVLKETVFLWPVSRTEDSDLALGAQRPLNSEAQLFLQAPLAQVDGGAAAAGCAQNRVYSDVNC